MIDPGTASSTHLLSAPRVLRVVRTALADGTRLPLGLSSDGPFDTLYPADREAL